MRPFARVLCVAGLGLALLPVTGQCDKVKVMRQVSDEQLESILKEMRISYKKSQAMDDRVYTYERNHFSIRLINRGRDLWIVVVSGKASLEDVNRWNEQAKLSRAVLHDGPFGQSVSLESQLDCAGGVTVDMIRRFISRFDAEVLGFSKFLQAIVVEEEVIKPLTGAKLETVMRNLGVLFKKIDDKKGESTRYEYEKNGYKIQLQYQGDVLILESIFAKVSLEKINKYNLDRPFIRAVLRRSAQGKDYTSLEAYLDCQPGVTEGILRDFFMQFDGELKEFAKYLSI